MKYIPLIPLVIIIEMMAITFITWLVSQPNDMAVLSGVGLTCLNIFLHILIIKKLKTKIK